MELMDNKTLGSLHRQVCRPATAMVARLSSGDDTLGVRVGYTDEGIYAGMVSTALLCPIQYARNTCAYVVGKCTYP